MKKGILYAIMMLLMAVSAYSQNITVNGTVYSRIDDEPLIGATVMCTITQQGTATDIDGAFQLSVPEGATIKVSYVGYQTVELPAQESMTIYLDEDTGLLDELVVVGYQTVRKADLTGAVSVVSTKSLETSTDSDPMRALQGKVPGMTVSANGSPSGTGSVRIRGIGSFNASQDPLFIIDGVPTTATLNSLNMNDIESMQVLKDAASASIYGSRAANGVIIITTKKGKSQGKVNVSFNANFTTQFYSSQSKMRLLKRNAFFQKTRNQEHARLDIARNISVHAVEQFLFLYQPRIETRGFAIGKNIGNQIEHIEIFAHPRTDMERLVNRIGRNLALHLQQTRLRLHRLLRKIAFLAVTPGNLPEPCHQHAFRT